MSRADDMDDYVEISADELIEVRDTIPCPPPIQGNVPGPTGQDLDAYLKRLVPPSPEDEMPEFFEFVSILLS